MPPYWYFIFSAIIGSTAVQRLRMRELKAIIVLNFTSAAMTTTTTTTTRSNMPVNICLSLIYQKEKQIFTSPAY